VTITLYPAIDIKEGRAVRLVQGDFEQSTVFNEDPVAQAGLFKEQGATSLHVVDLDGALAGQPVHAPLAAAIAATFGGTVHFGGGLRSRAAIETAIAAGATRLVVGTAALGDDELLRWAIDRLGDGLVIALDAREGRVATHGWTQISDRDGMLGGPNLKALRRLAQAAPPLNVIASGGVGSLDDLRRLRDLGLENLRGVVVGRAIYEGRVTIPAALEVLGG
jgi:phosphoribosylformimino-5-aminoimidazole carboxamide ribotide isomerase